MEKKDWIQELERKAKKMKIELSNQQLEQFYLYMNLLLEWNEKINLTAITDPKEIILKHFIDSITIATYLKNAQSILDIGTGAGFPGIPLAILENSKDFILMDSLNKRIIFLQEVIQKLTLTRVQAIHGRAEELGKEKEHREHYDLVTSRAVAKLNILLEYMLPFIKMGGRCICMKSQEIEEELEEAKQAIELLGGKLEKVDEIILPESDVKRKIIVIQKVRQTPIKYPRKPGIPTKEPIQ
jgi:16S rRNA (guanine527-N7)-methyltransferase